MKKTLFLFIAALSIGYFSSAQQMQAKERAEFIAKEDFSKSKYKKVEKFGVTKEKSKVIISTPVIKENVKEYSGHYKVDAPDYIITLNIEDEKNIKGSIKEADGNNGYQTFELKNLIIQDALFKAEKINPDGSETPLEGVFIDKNNNGIVDFGLGLKLSKSITIANAIETNKLFFKKVN